MDTDHKRVTTIEDIGNRAGLREGPGEESAPRPLDSPPTPAAGPGDDAAASADGGWPKLEPFEREELLPDFPVEVLPPPLDKMVLSVSIFTQTPVMMAGTLMLPVLSTLYQRHYVVEVRLGWRETLSIFALCIAESGEQKSPVFGALFGPIQKFEFECEDTDRAAIMRNRAEKDVKEAQLAQEKKAAVKSGDLDKVRQCADDLSAFQEIHKRRWLADDVTPESLMNLLEQHGGITLASAEASAFLSTLCGSRYSAQRVPLDPLLKSFSGEACIVDRQTREGNRLVDPRLSLALCGQPIILREMLGDKQLLQQGLLGRFIFAYCPSAIGHRDCNPPTIPESLVQQYKDFIFTALRREDSGTLRMSAATDEMRQDYMERIEHDLAPGGPLADFPSWSNKLVGLTFRLAGLLHCARFPDDPAAREIDETDFQAACKLAAVFTAHAQRAFQSGGGNEQQQSAQLLLCKIRKLGKPSISKRDLWRACRGRFKSVEDMDASLSELAARGYTRTLETRREGSGRKSAPMVEVNPAVFR